MKRRIMLDMDGVLVDFDEQVKIYNARKENGKCDWKMLDKIGPKFWSSMKWLEEGRKLYDALLELVKKNPDLELGIASAIFLHNGKKGKLDWLAANCPEIQKQNIEIANKGIDKWRCLRESDILIDDVKENVNLHIDAHPDSRGILFTDAKTALTQVAMILYDDRELDKMCEEHDRTLENS
jgi:5'(3')-deoxyribonucleotidase